MALSESLPSRQRFYKPLNQDVESRLVDGHICDRGYRAEQRPSPDSAEYAKGDALLDIPEGLGHRPLRVEAIEVHTIDAVLFSHVWRAVELTPPIGAVARADPHDGECYVSGRVLVHCLSQ
jgi:hypothetical protein